MITRKQYPNHHVFETEIGGRAFTVETGKVAELADAECICRYGDTVVLVTAVASPLPKAGIDYFPLTIEVEERMYAVGRIPGSFNRREGKPSERGILNSRIIDRPMRPLFPKDYRNDVTLNNLVLSVDPTCSPELTAMLGSAIATAISDIPFAGPCAMTQIGMIDGEFIVNPGQAQLKVSDLKLTVASTREKVIMIEAGANEIPEAKMIEAIYKAHEVNQQVIAFIDQIVAECGKEKHSYTSCAVPEELFAAIKEIVPPAEMEEAVFTDEKQKREENIRKITERLEEAFENQEVLTAKVAQVLDGGLSVEVEGSRVFIPASLVSDSYEKDLSKYKDQDIEFVISEFNPKRRRIIGDRKQLLVAKKLEQQKELFAKIKVGDVMEGTVKNVTDFGAFIDLGGADGLLHISEMSWGRVESPKKVFNVGDHVRVFIKDINDTKIALSMKFPAENPWNGAAEKYAVGNVVKGKVARMTDFGAFVELAPGVDALLHVSQIAKEHIEKPSDVLKVGQEIEAKIVDFNEDEKKISLSIKALLAPETNESEDADVADVDIDAVAAEEN